MGIAHLDNLLALPRGAELVLYGCGKLGRQVRKLLLRYRQDVRVTAYVSTQASTPVDGLDVLGPDELARRRAGGWRPLVVIASNYVDAIYLELARRGIVDALVACQQFLPRCLLPCAPEDFASRLEDVKELFSHPADREFLDHVPALYQEAADVSETRRFFLARYAQAGEQYFDHVHCGAVRSVIDGGAYDGHTMLRFALRFNNPRIYGFEPTPAYELGPYADHLRGNPDISVFPLGLYDGEGTMAMDHIGFGASMVEAREDSPLVIRTTSIDGFCQEQGVSRIDFIKLDIEGCEGKALLGGACTIAASRPQLAVCLYHNPLDYCEIPQILGSMLSDYDLRIGCHTPGGSTETVLYALPRALRKGA